VIKIKELLNLHNDDFILWKEKKYDLTWYHLSIEGYIGFETLDDAIGLYNLFLKELEEYLTENNHPKPNKNRGRRIVYKVRGMEVCYEHEYYWVFLDGYKSTDIWDIYYYLKDVIEQLRRIEV
jgi:hypothetical protein